MVFLCLGNTSFDIPTLALAVIMGLACLRSDLDNQRLVNNSEEDNLNGLGQSLGLLEDIEISANSAVEVLNEVLQYDKVERSALKLELSMVEIFDIVEKVRERSQFSYYHAPERLC